METKTINLTYTTFIYPLHIPVAYRARLERVRARCDELGIDWMRTFSDGVPIILDLIEQQLDTVPDYMRTATVNTSQRPVQKRKRQSNDVSKSELNDLVPPATTATLINGTTDTDNDGELEA